MTHPVGVANTAIAVTFDTVTTVQQAASNAALAVSDLYRLKPLKFWGTIGAVVVVAAASVALARR